MSSNQNAPPQNQQPAPRDMMFCHECADEWYRDEHGLMCPECHSDFTEIIEDNNDPRDSIMFGHDGDHGDHDSLPDLEEAPPFPHPHHNPWLNDDPEEQDISNVHFTQTAPGRYNVQATIHRTVSPQGGTAPGSIGGFMALLNGLTGAATQGQGQPRGQGEGLFPGAAPNPDQATGQESEGQGTAGGPHFRRFTYQGGARFTQDGNGPVRSQPVDEITNVMTGLFAALGAPPAHIHAGAQPPGGAQGPFAGAAHNHEAHAAFAGHPILQLFQNLGMGVPGGNMGDFVYSQEGLDRIVSQLMEQTASSNAPPPATQDDIDALPRKKVSEDMLGDEHKAECSICMDEVNIGEQVTELPCKHWFHHQCVSAWLVEHDTCPHCRKGISTHAEGESNNAAPSSPQAGRTSQMPGSFTPSGSGTIDDPYVVPAGTQSPPANQSGSTDNASTSPGNGGISDRIRRGLFGSPQ